MKTNRRPMPAHFHVLMQGVPSSVGGTQRVALCELKRRDIEAEILYLQHQIRLLTAEHVRLGEDLNSEQ